MLTLSLGLGISCLLILIILHLCGLYRREETPLLSHQTSPPPVDLDSDMVDYDINTQLYTPLPEPKIMKMSHEVNKNLNKNPPPNYDISRRHRSSNFQR